MYLEGCWANSVENDLKLRSLLAQTPTLTKLLGVETKWMWGTVYQTDKQMVLEKCGTADRSPAAVTIEERDCAYPCVTTAEDLLNSTDTSLQNFIITCMSLGLISYSMNFELWTFWRAHDPGPHDCARLLLYTISSDRLFAPTEISPTPWHVIRALETES